MATWIESYSTMRICILTTSFPLYEGIAVGIHVMEQAHHLVKLDQEVTVIAPHHQGARRQEKMGGVQVYRFRYLWPQRAQTLCYGAGIPTNLRRSWWARLQLPFFMLAFLVNAVRRARKSDLIHAHWSLAGLVGVIAGKILGKPVVLMMHGAEVFVLKGNPMIRFLLRRADFVLTNSSYTQAQIMRVGQPRHIRVISPGVNLDRFRPVADLAPFYHREPDISRHTPLIFALGKFIERKGFTHLLDAFATLTGDPLPFLMLGGRGPLKERLQAQAVTLGVADRIKFLGYIPDDLIPAYYAAADIFVLPSVVDAQDDTEGLGVVLLEAMACQTPCVASRVGGIPDAMVDGQTGFLVPPADVAALAARMKQLLHDPELCRHMGQQGQRHVQQHFSWESQAASILAVYQQLGA